jgi:hypothetical protein
MLLFSNLAVTIIKLHICIQYLDVSKPLHLQGFVSDAGTDTGGTVDDNRFVFWDLAVTCCQLLKRDMQSSLSAAGASLLTCGPVSQPVIPAFFVVYLNPFPAKLIIHRDHVTTENSNNPHGIGVINPADFSPSPKNPVIARIFKEIERAEELGSGVRNLFKYGKAFAGHDPQLLEEQIFRVTVSIPSFASTEKRTPEQATEQATEQAKRIEQLIEYCQLPRSRSELQAFIGVKHREHFRSQILQPLLEQGLIVMIIPDKPSSPNQRYLKKAKQ